jgi:hypothetical protein
VERQNAASSDRIARHSAEAALLSGTLRSGRPFWTMERVDKFIATDFRTMEVRRMANPKQTSPKVARDAAKDLPKKGVPLKEKEFGGSALSQAPGKPKKK